MHIHTLGAAVAALNLESREQVLHTHQVVQRVVGADLAAQITCQEQCRVGRASNAHKAAKKRAHGIFRAGHRQWRRRWRGRFGRNGRRRRFRAWRSRRGWRFAWGGRGSWRGRARHKAAARQQQRRRKYQGKNETWRIH
ncbi:hypothetical protein SE17_12905 [Kouleothrix aurantiaca]|uniref:Uncharacterized protein n=1 Tax=Kouleothrix aurantiaca TaxID=186479 RepID=A0A0N8PSJ1_9CHLR|nr:hypothetical protein SE17_12905 [Kouleothrix aurantiaca]